MKPFKVLLSILLCCSFFLSEAQIRAGFKLSPGLGYLTSRNFKRFYQNLESETSSNDNFNTSFRLRSHFGLGGFIEYKFSENVFFAAEPTMTFSSNKIIITHNEDNVSDLENGTVTRTSSQARIRAPYISLPLLAKFRFHHRKELFVFGGFALNFHFNPVLFSNEESVTVAYEDGVSNEYPRTVLDNRVKLKSYRFININPVIGIGKVFNPYGRNIIVDIRYSHPLTKSSLYAQGTITDSFMYNFIYTEEGKKYAETAYPEYKFNDFKMGVISFSVSYTLYKNYR